MLRAKILKPERTVADILRALQGESAKVLMGRKSNIKNLQQNTFERGADLTLPAEPQYTEAKLNIFHCIFIFCWTAFIIFWRQTMETQKPEHEASTERESVSTHVSITSPEAAEQHSYEMGGASSIITILESNTIIDIAIGVSWIGFFIIVWLAVKLVETKAFWHLCILAVLLLGLSGVLTMYIYWVTQLPIHG